MLRHALLSFREKKTQVTLGTTATVTDILFELNISFTVTVAVTFSTAALSD